MYGGSPRSTCTAAGVLAFGIWLLVVPPDMFSRLVAVWAVGAGLNYVPLALVAFDVGARREP